VWLHDRRARTMVLSASSDAVYLEQGRQVSTADALAPAAVALRRERAEIASNQDGASNTVMVTVPLKGRRRALGTFVMDGVRLDPGREIELLERADEMGRQLSAAIENVLLLEDVLQSRRELDNTFILFTAVVVRCCSIAFHMPQYRELSIGLKTEPAGRYSVHNVQMYCIAERCKNSLSFFRRRLRRI